MYSKIINPKTNRKVKINSKLGKLIIMNYYNFIQGGSDINKETDIEDLHVSEVISSSALKHKETDIEDLHVLVVCSSPGPQHKDFNNNKDYFEKNFNHKNKKIIYDYLGGKSAENMWPVDIPKDKKYDIVWFCGCNLIGWISSVRSPPIYEVLIDILKDTGLVLFTEAPKMVNNIKDIEITDKDKQNVPSVRIELLDRMTLQFASLPDIINEFYKRFELSDYYPYVYTYKIRKQ